MIASARCTCPETDPLKRAAAYTVRHFGVEPHAADCPRWGMTKVQVGDPDPTPVLDDLSDYCWAPHRLDGRTAYCSWPLDHFGDHVTVVASWSATVAAVWSGDHPPAGRVWSPRDRRPWVMGPDTMGLTDAAWTDAMAVEGRATGVNRQCSIGWHTECSDPEGETCRCACHGGD